MSERLADVRATAIVACHDGGVADGAMAAAKRAIDLARCCEVLLDAA